MSRFGFYKNQHIMGKMILLNQYFKAFISLLNNNKVRYLVVGGYAIALHGHPRYQKSNDIWIELTPERKGTYVSS